MASTVVPHEQQRPPAGWWPEGLASVAAIAGLVLSILPGYHPYTWAGSGTDLKTVYAAAWNLTRYVDAYSFGTIAQVFAQNHVIAPESWYAHAPVYPPFTLAIMGLLTAGSMVTALYTFMLISGVAIAAAGTVLARAGWESFHLNRLWRLALIGLIAACPLVSFGLEVGNVSVLVAACCVYAVAAPRDSSFWLRAAALGLGLLLKPHLALWVLLALALAPNRRGRTVALQTAAVTAGALVVIAGWLAARGQLVPQTASYLHMVKEELAHGGSMNAASHEILTVTAQITSIRSLFGYWEADAPWMLHFATPIVVLLGLALVWVTLRHTYAEDERPYAAVGAWCGFGLLATYHRAHDAIVLLVLLPWLLARLRRNWTDLVSWLTFLSFTLMCVGPDLGILDSLERTPPVHILAGIFLRQSPFFALVLTVTLVIALARREPPLDRPAAA